MNIFERLYNKVFHNKALIKENELEREMFSALEGLSKKPKFSAFQKAEEMVNCVERYLGEIVKNRENLWTGRNKVSKFLSNIQNKGSIEDKVFYLAGATKDKKFSGLSWARKIGPVFLSLKLDLESHWNNPAGDIDMMDVFKRLEHLGLIGKDSDFSFFIMGFNTARGVILKYGGEKLAETYGEVILKNIDSYVLWLFCAICEDLKTYSKIDRDLLNSAKIKGSKNDTIVQSVEEVKKAIDYFQDIRKDILNKMYSAPEGNFIDSISVSDLLSAAYGFYSQGSNKMKKIVDEGWEKLTNEIYQEQHGI